MSILFDEKRRCWTPQGDNVTYGMKLDKKLSSSIVKPEEVRDR